ncbi:hypothetical protein GCM10020229_01260 [Kitasatospora albolonga]|uniref:polyprenyl synthetase n=1 Tax=Kitasatospora albolonga TaxID=68173 RepID=UPI0031EC3B38
MVAANGNGKPADRGAEAVQLLAGVVDLGLEQAEGLLRRLRGTLGRSDLDALLTDGQEDLRARGELLLGRLATGSEPHMEAVARRSAAYRKAAGGG